MTDFSFQLDLSRPEFKVQADASFQKGECLGVFGHSGAGKSSLLRVLAGLEKHAKGSFKLGVHEFPLYGKNRFKEQVLLFQDGLLFPHFSVEKNLAFARAHASEKRFMNEHEIIERLGIKKFMKKTVSQLSGGERKRIALAQVLFTRPGILLLDEPFAFLDANTKSKTIDMLQLLKKQYGLSMILVSHEMLDLCQLADSLLIMEKGQVCFQGTVDEALTSRHSPLIRQMGYFMKSPFVSIKASVEAFDKSYGLSELRTQSGQKIRVSTEHKVGDNVLVKIDAQQVSLAVIERQEGAEQRGQLKQGNQLEHLSILNQLDGKIEEVLVQDDYKVLLLINCGGDKIMSQVSSLSFEKMALEINKSVKVLIKAASIHEI